MQLDHLMWACSDLSTGVADIAELTGVTPEYSGSHTGLGTRNALLSLGSDCYLEIIAPDPAQSLEGNFGGRLAQLNSSGLLAFAMAQIDLDNLKVRLTAQNYQLSRVTRTKRATTDGGLLEWDLLFVAGLPGAPFFIDWLECEHPAQTSPYGCQLISLTVQSSKPQLLEPLLGDKALSPRLRLVDGEAGVRLFASIDSPNGVVELQPLGVDIALF